jgi:hypothetical protein
LKETELKDMDQLMNDAAEADRKRRSIYYEMMHGLTEEQKEKLVGKKKKKTTEIITEPTTDDTVTYGQPKINESELNEDSLLEMFDNPYELEDVTHNYPDFRENVKSMGYSQVKFWKANDMGHGDGDHHFMTVFRDGAYELHHFHPNEKDGKSTNDMPVANRFVATSLHMAKTFLDRDRSVRIVGSPDHVHNYHRIAKSLISKRGRGLVTGITESPNLSGLDDQPYEFTIHPNKPSHISESFREYLKTGMIK